MDLERAVEAVREATAKVASARGADLVDVELKRRPEGPLLRIYVDREGGIGLDELQALSEEVSVQLDVLDPLPSRYTLEVSSPGLDRPLVTEADWRRARGQLVSVGLDAPLEGRREWTGRLAGVEGGVLSLETEKAGVLAVPLARVARGRREVDWKRPARAGREG